MCTKFTDPPYTTLEPIIAYKVTQLDRTSEYAPDQRIPQKFYGFRQVRTSLGNTLRYEKGKTISSPIPATPGIYLYTSRESCIRLQTPDTLIIKVEILAKTIVQPGMLPWNEPTINASACKVLE